MRPLYKAVTESGFKVAGHLRHYGVSPEAVNLGDCIINSDKIIIDGFKNLHVKELILMLQLIIFFFVK